ncbi:UDP-N-acetylmuramate dehydrogenase [Aquiflexum balticum DSM 16537]|uniref:UDP-N-acetylenolpyruvoylglucosamine reductase n=2 Tax=Aquiflexum TaxID=280472 RepID=A0A1W2H808_9BACT|nr:UDP-N-acetylmuramate dehydrogenase [Aquiflexum balticum DSM 16537]
MILVLEQLSFYLIKFLLYSQVHFQAMNIQENISLKPYNTFGIDKKARYFINASSENEIKKALIKAKELGLPVIILGGGSNILLTRDLDSFVLKIDIKGIKILEQSKENIIVEVGAGENWHEFVLHCLHNNWSGVENLSLIPGTVGASPMQNIGAYGIEIKDVFQGLKAINRETLEEEEFDWKACRFGYRESIFKNDLKNKYIITRVIFKLNKIPVFHTEYGAIKETLAEMKVKELSISAISNAVIKIRQSKLPDPKIIGNAGSFFKNPTVSDSLFENLRSTYPNIPGYPNEGGVKIPAAWLIEQTGWKGKKLGNIGVHKQHPLVLVNYGGGDGKDIQQLSEEIQQSVLQKFNVQLQPEVNFL